MIEKPAEGQTVNILLVDDDVRNLDALESILLSPDLRLVRAQNPDEALLALVHDEFACIVLDIQMPSMTGLELSRLIKTRKRSQHIPIIFLTAYFLDEKDILQGYGAGAVDYLTKPVSPQILKSKVGVFVDLFRSTRALAKSNNALEQEVVQRKKAEESLRQANDELEMRVQERTVDLTQSEQRYRHLVYSLPAAVYTTDAEGRVTLYNETAAQLWQRKPEIGKDLWCGSYKIFKPDGADLPADQCPMAITLKQGRAVRGEEIIIERPDGSRRNVLPYPEPLFDAAGKLSGAVNMLVDITELKSTEHKLKKARDEAVAASRAKDDFLATLSHELRTPLNPVLLIASDAVKNSELPPRVRTDFDTIRKNVELEARLIDDLLDLTRIASGKVILNKRLLDVRQVLQDAIKHVQEDINQKQIALAMDVPTEQPALFADPVRLQQIFWNLLKNAVKFTPNGGRITVENNTHGDKLVIKVTDTGMGMLPEEIVHIFTAFSQGKHSSGSSGHHFGGLGLGLAISQKLAEFHSGKILAASKGRDQGSTFTIELPLAHTAGEGEEIENRPAGSSSKAQPRGKGIRILLVEDHAPTRTALTQLLMRRSYKVMTAGTVAEARTLAAAESFDLVVSDIGLPDGNGYDLMIELRKYGKFSGIALTGYGMEQDVERSHAAGFVVHLTKPVSIEALENALNIVNASESHE